MKSPFPSDASFGVIPLRQTEHGHEYLCLQHAAGHWDFPKGHPEGTEEPQETAARELQEETGLSVREWLPYSPLVIEYEMTKRDGERVHKTVTYFPALVVGKMCRQEQEVSALIWGSAAATIDRLTYENSRQLVRQVEKQLSR